jgi:tRNA(Arg) A34 adenosine deaminase TadA
MPPPAVRRSGVASLDEERMRELVRFTARTLETAYPAPFGALIVDTKSGEHLMQATNAVMRENDPSSHAAVRTIRLACRKLKTSFAVPLLAEDATRTGS